MSQGTVELTAANMEGAAAPIDHAVSALVSACGPDDAVLAARFKEAISGEESEAVQVAQLSEALCAAAVDHDQKDMFATAFIRDGFFVPLALHATLDAVFWLSRAMHIVSSGVDGRRRQAIFATEAVRDGFFLPLVKHATSDDAVYWLSRAISTITGGCDASAGGMDIFATAAVRDEFFIPLAKQATAAGPVYGLSHAIRDIAGGSDAGAAQRKDIFAIGKFRDEFFLPAVKYATSSEAVSLSRAMHTITNGTDVGAARRRDIFATDAVRDGFFLPLVQHATSAKAAKATEWLSMALGDITAGNDLDSAFRRDVFATETVRDGFFLQLAKHATTAKAAINLAVAMLNIICGNDATAPRRRSVFANDAVRDGFVPLSRHPTAHRPLLQLARALFRGGNDTHAPLVRSTNRPGSVAALIEELEEKLSVQLCVDETLAAHRRTFQQLAEELKATSDDERSQEHELLLSETVAAAEAVLADLPDIVCCSPDVLVQVKALRSRVDQVRSAFRAELFAIARPETAGVDAELKIAVESQKRRLEAMLADATRLLESAGIPQSVEENENDRRRAREFLDRVSAEHVCHVDPVE